MVIVSRGEEFAELQKLAERLNIAKRVYFLGWVVNPHKYVKNAKLFVLSSDIEGFGNVIVESLSVGTPAVSTDCPVGPREILDDDLASFLSEPGSIQDLKIKIEVALSSYPKIDTDMLLKFDSDKITNEYLKLGLDN